MVLCYIGITSPEISDERVAIRVSQGGHDVPREKLEARFPRILANLATAARQLPLVLIFDNSNLSAPFRRLAVFERGRLVECAGALPDWLEPLVE